MELQGLQFPEIWNNKWQPVFPKGILGIFSLWMHMETTVDCKESWIVLSIIETERRRRGVEVNGLLEAFL